MVKLKIIQFSYQLPFIYFFFLQRRSLAPSQFQNSSTTKRPPEDATAGVGAFKCPLQIDPSSRKKRKCQDKNENKIATQKPVKLSVSDYESIIAKVLSKAFKVPIPNYVPDSHGGNRCLGLKRSSFRR